MARGSWLTRDDLDQRIADYRGGRH
jgi:hypothetical protein